MKPGVLGSFWMTPLNLTSLSSSASPVTAENAPSASPRIATTLNHLLVIMNLQRTIDRSTQLRNSVQMRKNLHPVDTHLFRKAATEKDLQLSCSRIRNAC